MHCDKDGCEAGSSMTFEERRARAIVEKNAWAALAGSRFMVFGQLADTWVEINRICRDPQPNPFAALVQSAKLNVERTNEE